MKLEYFLAGMAVGLLLYALRPRYYPAIVVEENFEVPDDIRLTEILEQVVHARRYVE